MESTIINKKNLIIAIIMLASVLTRLVPHLPNFTPVTAIALFGGLYPKWCCARCWHRAVTDHIRVDQT